MRKKTKARRKTKRSNELSFFGYSTGEILSLVAPFSIVIITVIAFIATLNYSILLFLVIALFMVVYILSDRHFKNKEQRDSIRFQLEVMMAIFTVFSVFLAQLAISQTQESLNFARAEANKVPKLESHSIMEIPLDGAIEPQFWVENSGYSTIILNSTCSLELNCDGNIIQQHGIAKIVYKISDKTENGTENNILQVGEMALFRSTKQIRLLKDTVKGMKNCYMECFVMDTRYSDINALAKIPVKLNLR